MKPITSIQLDSFRQFLDAYASFIIMGHKEPDGDCIASCIALAALLDRLDKPYQLVSAGPFKRPEIRRFENRFARIIRETATALPEETGLIITDCAEIHRLGDVGADCGRYPKFIIDHHKTSDGTLQNAVIDPSAPATAAIVQVLYESLIGAPDEDTASILFFGLASDTGFFRFLSSNSADIFRSAARLTECGASPRLVYDEMTGGKPFPTRKLLGLMLERTECKCGGKVAVTYELMEDTRRYGQEGRDSDSLYQLLLSVSGVEAVVFVRQETDRRCTVGLRSRDSIDVSVIAAKFGGGGHKNAAGLSTEGSVPVLISQILKEFETLF